MKTIQKLLLIGAIVIGMAACNNDDVPKTPESLKGSTYASVSVTLPKTVSTRALPGDYNDKGTWNGIDAINNVTVFLVNSTLGTIDYSTFGTSQFTGITGSGTLKPNLAVKATPGENVKAYVVLNSNSAVLATLKTATPKTFDDVYATTVEKNASDLASNNSTNDVIMMTNTILPVGVTIASGVSEADAKTGSVNTIKVDVERVVSRAIATVKAGTHTIDVNNAMKEKKSTITIQSINYVVGQSNKEFFLTKKTDWTTPTAVYGHVPGTDVWNPALFDNTGLDALKSIPVQVASGAAALADFQDALLAEKATSKFILPVTHADANYRKGNTTYFEIAATFTPDAVFDGAYTVGDDVFLGMNDGLFYNSRANAEASGQKATEYKGDGSTGAIMKYVLWLNPNKIPGTDVEKATMSPTVRNQVYHAHINSFKSIGIPNNPLDPTDPNDPLNPKNPIDPNDPLETEDTYLSVEITVLKWGVHSYAIDLDNDY